MCIGTCDKGCRYCVHRMLLFAAELLLQLHEGAGVAREPGCIGGSLGQSGVLIIDTCIALVVCCKWLELCVQRTAWPLCLWAGIR